MAESAAAFKGFVATIVVRETGSDGPEGGQRVQLLARRLGALLQESLFTTGDDTLASLEGVKTICHPYSEACY